MNLQAQKLTEKQAITYAEKLYQVEILSEKGKNYLIARIENKEIKRNKISDLNTGGITILDSLCISSILLSCANMFESDFNYRTGIKEYVRILKEDKEISNLMDSGNEEQMEKGQKLLEEKMTNFEGLKIEEEIAIEDDTTGKVSEEYITFPPLSFVGNIDDFGFVNLKRSVFGKQNLRTLQELKSIGLINDIVYTEVLEIISQSYLGTHRLFEFLSERTAFYEDFEENKMMELQFINNLQKQNLISKEKQNELVSSYKPFELKQKFDFVRYCDKAIIFDVTKLPQEPEKAYPIIFDKIKSIIPDFEFMNLHAKIVIDDRSPDFIEEKIDLSLEAKGRKYKTNFFYDFVKKNPKKEDEVDTLFQIGKNFHKIVNKFLADQNSEYRLYYANKTEFGNAYGKTEFGLILMTEDQAKAWGVSSYFIFEESHDNRFNSDNIKAIIVDYEAIGLFKHLTQEEIKIGKDKIQESIINSYSDILNCFPRVTLYIGWETGNFTNPYEELVKDISLISKDLFNPTQIIDTFEKNKNKKTTKFGFTLKGKKYSKDLEMMGDNLDYAFLELIEQAIKEQKIGGQIYYCNDDDEATYIFLTSAQYKYLKENQSDLFSE